MIMVSQIKGKELSYKNSINKEDMEDQKIEQELG